jgi:hypothetical protein
VASEALVRAIFVVLALATVGAFFLAQRLKSGAPPIERVYFQPVISPNGDGRKDSVTLRFDLPRPDRVEVALVDSRGEVRRRLADERLGTGTHRFPWNGLDDRGRRAPDGAYVLRVRLADQGRTLLSSRTLTVDTVPPSPRVVAVTPATIVPGTSGRRGRARIRYLGPTDPAPEFTVLQATASRRGLRPVAQFVGPRFRQTATWDGRVRGGRLAPSGRYVFGVRATDPAGNTSGRVPFPAEGVRVRARP